MFAQYERNYFFFFYFNDNPRSGQRLTAPGGHLFNTQSPSAHLPSSCFCNELSRSDQHSHIRSGLMHYINSCFLGGSEGEYVCVLIMTLTMIEQLGSF